MELGPDLGVYKVLPEQTLSFLARAKLEGIVISLYACACALPFFLFRALPLAL